MATRIYFDECSPFVIPTGATLIPRDGNKPLIAKDGDFVLVANGTEALIRPRE